MAVALVTGAAQGIGRAIAAGLAGEGLVVVCGAVLDASETAELVGGRAFSLDVSDASQVRDAFAVAAGLGELAVLVNNAGIFPRSPVLDLEESEWQRVQDVNLKGTFLCAQAAARVMREQGHGGRIVNVTSGAAFVSSPQGAAYAASKAGIVAFTRVLALELAPDNVTVNAVAPGFTDTAQPRSFFSDDDLAAIAKRIPAGRLAEPEEIVPAVLYLCSEAAAYVTGQTLHVNGGLYMP
jgi:NAD(P)-dependent dehydrogenase (short-subunit alcohol dehydrogenase family)